VNSGSISVGSVTQGRVEQGLAGGCRGVRAIPGSPADFNPSWSGRHPYPMPGYDECGLSQIGLPDSGGIGFGAIFGGVMGARASFR
jgi:hypothetical protein